MIGGSFRGRLHPAVPARPRVANDLIAAYREGGCLLNLVLWLSALRWARLVLASHLPPAPLHRPSA